VTIRSLELRLLGGFDISVDGNPLPPDAFKHGRARDLVKLLALAPGHRLARERAVEELWPQLGADAGLANLHKASHHARRALGHAAAVVLSSGHVALAPDAHVETDVEHFKATGDPDLYAGELLPDDRYASWVQEPREQLHLSYLESLRRAGRWAQLAAEEPTDEPAQRAVMRERIAAGDRAGALQAYERLRAGLAELGLQPGTETLALHGQIAGGASLQKALAAVELAVADAPAAERAQLLATRADLLLAIGDRGAPAAYAEAAAAAGPEGMALRIRQAWAQIAGGDPASAQATLARLNPYSDAERAGHLIASAAAAWFAGDLEGALRAAEEAEALAVALGLDAEARAAIHVQAMVAHSSGTWKDRLRSRAEAALGTPSLADTVFDGHLCVAEYSLGIGESPQRLRALAEELHAGAVRTGARRAQAFAATLLGEVALIPGALDEAEPWLQEAVRLSREIGAISAEALAQMRLGEAARARGERDQADALLGEALVVARWSPLQNHLPPLAYAALLRATDDPELGRTRLDEAEAFLRTGTLPCAYCGTVFGVAAAISAARGAQLERADGYLAGVLERAQMWLTGPWPAILAEARGEVALAHGDPRGRTELAAALDGFAREGWRLEADRVDARLAALN
jgi:DNA-binding SARP family transcriptional activator